MEASESTDWLRGEVERALGQASGQAVRVSALAPLAGGASQEAWSVDLELADGACLRLVLRRDLGGALSGAVLSRDREFAILRALHGAGAPVPRPYWFLPALGTDGSGAPRAAFLMERLEGETIGRRIVRDPALAEARTRLPAQMAGALAAIHRLDVAAHGLQALRAPGPGMSAAEARLELLEADLRRIDEPHPALELGLRWLRGHAPPAGDLVLVHGDFRVGNFMVGPEGLRGVLDWENAHLGDRHEDLAWVCVRAWRFGQDHLPAGGISAREPFIRAYEAASGHHVDRPRAFYWEVMGNLQWAVGALGQARRHLHGQARSIELASLGRIAAEMELELLDLIEIWETGALSWIQEAAEVSDAG